MSGTAAAVAAALRQRQSFLLTSHARPDGDAVGSSVALALALEQIGKQVTIVLRDPVPAAYEPFPSIGRIVRADRATTVADAAVLLECSDVTRPGIAGLESYLVINVDHHLGNGMYGDVNWFDPSAAACSEMVAELIDELGVTWTADIAAHLYLGIATDTGSFRYGPISARTFEICQRIVRAGVEPGPLSRQIFDSFSIGRVRLTGAMLNAMELHHGDRFAVLSFDDELLRRYSATVDDTEGLVNIPLTARDVVAAALFKRQDQQTFRVSLRSKGSVDVRAVAARWGGGGHLNAAGCTLTGDFETLKAAIVEAMEAAIDAGEPAPRTAGR